MRKIAAITLTTILIVSASVSRAEARTRSTGRKTENTRSKTIKNIPRSTGTNYTVRTVNAVGQLTGYARLTIKRPRKPASQYDASIYDLSQPGSRKYRTNPTNRSSKYWIELVPTVAPKRFDKAERERTDTIMLQQRLDTIDLWIDVDTYVAEQEESAVVAAPTPTPSVTTSGRKNPTNKSDPYWAEIVTQLTQQNLHTRFGENLLEIATKRGYDRAELFADAGVADVPDTAGASSSSARIGETYGNAKITNMFIQSQGFRFVELVNTTTGETGSMYIDPGNTINPGYLAGEPMWLEMSKASRARISAALMQL